MNPLAILGAIFIGLSLGLTGAGGSILTLPVLVYLAGVPPNEAVGLSLLIVGTSAGMGAIQRARLKEFSPRAAALFSLSGAIGTYGGSHLTHLVPATTLMRIFAGLMILVGLRMLRGTDSEPPASGECHPKRCVLAGLGVGILTGFLGVGGGMFLMPALIRFAKLPVRSATGTSLAIIACNSAIGFLSHLGSTPIPIPLATLFTLIAALGVLAGGRLASRLPERQLKLTFALLIFSTAAFVIARTSFHL